VLPFAYFNEVDKERRQLAPPVGVTDLSDFAEAMPPPSRWELVRHDGDEYVAWFGHLSGPFEVPSGRSYYLFDRQGKLVDWKPETGEGDSVDTFLKESSALGAITLDDALGRANSQP
jgi:hypothetical protein